MTSPEASITDFLRLDQTDLGTWLFAFLAEDPTVGANWAPFPRLEAGETRYGWLTYQFQLASTNQGRVGHLRSAIVELLRTDRFDRGRQGEVIGALVEVCGACGFTEAADVFASWIQDDRYATVRYHTDAGDRLLRTTLWGTLIAWKKASTLIAHLRRDLGRFGQDCTTIIFAELSRVDAEQAILAIPKLVEFQPQYWTRLVSEFLRKGSVATLLSARFKGAWQLSLTTIAFDADLSHLFASGIEENDETASPLGAAFVLGGATLVRVGDQITLHDSINPLTHISMLLSDAIPTLVAKNERSINRDLARGATFEEFVEFREVADAHGVAA